MATHTETKRVEIDKVVREWTTCDCCKAEIKTSSTFDVIDISLSSRIGSTYPDGGNVNAITIDFCEKCLREKVLPAMEALGVDWHEEERIW